MQYSSSILELLIIHLDAHPGEELGNQAQAKRAEAVGHWPESSVTARMGGHPHVWRRLSLLRPSETWNDVAFWIPCSGPFRPETRMGDLNLCSEARARP